MKTKSRIYEMGGVITEVNGDFCTLRLRLPAGIVTPDQLIAVGQIAQKYNLDNVHLTTRQTIEIPHIKITELEIVSNDLIANGHDIGAERAEVVNITACPGTDRCKLANIDSLHLAKEIDKRYFRKDMPGKIRIAISACPNGCTSETLNEIGITGLRKPIREDGHCTGCGTCVQFCREDAIEVRDGRIVMMEDRCLNCGTCIRSCLYGLLQSEATTYKITFGGRRGRHPKVGLNLITVNSEEAVLLVVDAIIDWIYRFARLDIPVVSQLGKDLKIEEIKEILKKKIPAESIVAE